MSANDILDVLNIQRDETQQPSKKRQKIEQPALQKGGMARELYNLLGPNTPPVNINLGGKGGARRQKVSPWTRMPFVPNKKLPWSATFHHWEKGSKELLEASGNDREYFFDKFLVAIDVPEMVDEQAFDNIMAEIKEQEQEREKQRTERAVESSKNAVSKADRNGGAPIESGFKECTSSAGETPAPNPDAAHAQVDIKPEDDQSPEKPKNGTGREHGEAATTEKTGDAADIEKPLDPGDDKNGQGSSSSRASASMSDSESQSRGQPSGDSSKSDTGVELRIQDTEKELENTDGDWTYSETKLLFEYCKDFELKWHVINDRFPACFGRSMEDLKEQFYRVCAKILKYNGTGNPNLLESLDAFSKPAEVDRKKYLESLLKRTPAEIAEEESLVIEARRFELAAKKMLMERTNLLTLMDSPQSSQSIQQYQSSQGLTNLYNNLMILDKHQKKKMQQKSMNVPADPVPPPIPLAASSSHKRDRSFQTHLQQYLAGVLKLQPPHQKGEPNPIQQLLAKRLTTKEEEAYGLMYHANERLTPNVILRSTQKLPGLQQRQSVFKAVNNMLQELEIPTSGGTSWKPNMPTRKTMAKYDDLVKSVVALLEVKKGKDKLEAEIALIQSQRGIE